MGRYTKKIMTCVHCGRPQTRRFCWTCDTPGVRELHKHDRTSKYGSRGIGLEPPKKWPQPTPLPPGPDKVKVLEERAANGEELFHPLDGRV